MSQIDLLHKAYFAGSYGTAYDICVGLIRSGEISGCVLMYRAFSAIGKTQIMDADLDAIRAELKLALEMVMTEADSTDSVIDSLDEIVMISRELCKSLKEKHDKELEALQSQFKGSVGVSFDSDDPAERQRQEAERQHNNAINKQIYRLNTKHSELVAVILDTVIAYTIQFTEERNCFERIPLSLVHRIDGCQGLDGSSVSGRIPAYVMKVKEERNNFYWSEHKQEHSMLLLEKRKREERICDTLRGHVNQAKHHIALAEEVIKFDKEKRKQYSIFNFSERKPFDKRISEMKAKIRTIKEHLAEYEAGICEECNHDRKRLSEIDAELNKQR